MLYNVVTHIAVVCKGLDRNACAHWTHPRQPAGGGAVVIGNGRCTILEVARAVLLGRGMHVPLMLLRILLHAVQAMAGQLLAVHSTRIRTELAKTVSVTHILYFGLLSRSEVAREMGGGPVSKWPQPPPSAA